MSAYFGSSVASLGGSGTRVGVAFVSLTTDNTGLARGFKQAESATNAWARKYGTTVGSAMYQTGRKATALGSTLTRSLTIPLVAAGGAATVYASKFQTAMARTVALANVSAGSIEKMSERVKELAVATARDPLEIANSLYFLASAGLKANEVMKALKATAQGAAAGLGDADIVSRTLIAALNAYRGTGTTVTKIMDTMTQAVREGNVETDEMATTIGAVIPIAAELGVSFDQAASAIAAATNVGVEAHRAVTGLRYLLINMERPTDKAKKVMANYGFTIADLQRKLADPNVGLLGTLEFMANTFDVTTVKGREAWQTVIGGVRGAIVANALIGKNLERTRDVFDAVGKAANDTKKQFLDAYHVMQQTPEFKFQQAFSELKVAAIDAGGIILPLVTELVDKLAGLARWFSGLPEPMQKVAIQMGAVAAAAGPLLWIFGKLMTLTAPVVARVAKAFGATGSLSLGTAASTLTTSGTALGTSAGVLDASGAALGTAAASLEAAAAALGLSGRAAGLTSIAGQQGLTMEQLISRGAAQSISQNPAIPTVTPYGLRSSTGTFTRYSVEEAEAAAYAAQAEARATAQTAANVARASAERAELIRTIGLSAPGGLTAGGELAAGEVAAGGTAAGGGLVSGLVSTGLGAILVGAIVGMGGALSRVKDEWHRSFQDMSADTNMSVQQVEALGSQFENSAAWLNPFRSRWDFVNEAGMRYRDVLKEATQNGMSMYDAQRKLNGAWHQAVGEIGGTTGSLDRFQQTLEASLGLAKSPGLQDLQNFLHDWQENANLPPLTIGGVPINMPGGGRGQGPQWFQSFLPERTPPAISDEQIRVMQSQAYSRLTRQGMPIEGIDEYLGRLSDFIHTANDAVNTGAKISDVLEQARRAAQLGAIQWRDYVNIVEDFGRKLPFRQAGEFQQVLLRSPMVTNKLARETIGLNNALGDLGIKLKDSQYGYLNYRLAQGNSLAQDKVFGTYLRGPLKGILADHRNDLTQTQRKTIAAWREDGKWVQILQHLAHWLKQTEGRHKGSLDFKVTGLTDARTLANTVRDAANGRLTDAQIGPGARQRGSSITDASDRAPTITPKVDDEEARMGIQKFGKWITEQNPKVPVDADTDPAKHAIDQFVRTQDQTVFIDVVTRYRSRGNRGGGGTGTGGGGGGGTGGGGGGGGGGGHGGIPPGTYHFGGWTRGGWVQTDIGEMVIRNQEASRHAQILNRINSGMGATDPEVRELRRDLARQHEVLMAQQREIARVLTAGGHHERTSRRDGDVFLDGHRVGSVLDARKRRASRHA